MVFVTSQNRQYADQISKNLSSPTILKLEMYFRFLRRPKDMFKSQRLEVYSELLYQGVDHFPESRIREFCNLRIFKSVKLTKKKDCLPK